MGFLFAGWGHRRSAGDHRQISGHRFDQMAVRRAPGGSLPPVFIRVLIQAAIIHLPVLDDRDPGTVSQSGTAVLCEHPYIRCEEVVDIP